jgi:hypothetical protein
MTPRTAAGKRLLGGLRHYSMPLGGEYVPVSESDAAEMIAAIEDEAVADYRRELAEKVRKLPSERIENDGNIGRHAYGRNIVKRDDSGYIEVVGRAAALALIEDDGRG